MARAAKNIDALRALMAAGSWREAVLMAASFPRLPDQYRGHILSAREAYLRPDFQREMHRDVDALIAAGVQALQKCYGQQP